MQKWHQSTVYAGELNAFLVIAFIIACVYSTVMSLISLRKMPKTDEPFKVRFPFLALIPILVVALAGACGAVNNMFNLFLSGKMDSAVFFPIVNGGGLILSTVCAIILFRERLTIRQWIGMGFGVVAVFLLCI
jgi:drug/metabolite transporter (DMT)-like permease